jgi:hypothetical protein
MFSHSSPRFYSCASPYSPYIFNNIHHDDVNPSWKKRSHSFFRTLIYVNTNLDVNEKGKKNYYLRWCYLTKMTFLFYDVIYMLDYLTP